MKIWEISGKDVRIVLNDGQVFSGIAECYTSEFDNEGIEHRPPAASICIGIYELYEDEIASIELASEKMPLVQAI